MGLKNLLIEAGFDEDKILSHQWGTHDCAVRDLEPGWARYDPAVDTLENEAHFPVMSWAHARM